MESSVRFISGKKKTRGELRLPQLHFVVLDDWQHKIGKEAIWAWLQFYSWADRSQSDREADVIPNSMNKIQKKLGIGKDTFYNKIIRPLWNFGFIDLQEIETNGKTGHNPVNIIVYEYPQNDPDRITKPLEQVRDYDQDYQTETRKSAQKGGRPKKRQEPSSDRELPQSSSGTELPLVPTENYPSSDTEPNNVLNQSNVLKDSNVKKIDIDSEAVRNAIVKDKKLLDRMTDLHQVYLLVKEDPFYSDALFVRTAKKSVKAILTHTTFEDYFLTSMLNNMKQEKQKIESQTPKDNKSDLPEWIARKEAPATKEELTEEQKAAAADLLRQLGEIE
jgi:hypothetical protein